MAVLHPLKLTIAGDGWTDPASLGRGAAAATKAVTVPDFPFDPTRGSHSLLVERTVYIDRSDFRLDDSAVSQNRSFSSLPSMLFFVVTL